MIINVTYGGSASDAARYIEGAAKEEGKDVPGTEDRARLLGSEGFGFQVRDREDVLLALATLRRDVELQASNTKPVENTVIHASMSWPQGYEPSREEMLEAADHLAKAWGMEAYRRISWSHEETKHRHIHTLFGSIHPDTGYAHRDHELNDRAQRAAIDWERKHGIPPTRQKDHDKAAAAEASDHARTMDLSRNTDGSISRRSLDRALSLGGWFKSDKAAQRAEFIAYHDLIRFPAQEFGYSSKPLAEEKAEYILQNRDSASSLTRAYNREAKERATGIFRLYEDHSFEKTSKPRAQEERERDMGRINDALDWPWNRIGVNKITDKWQDWRDERRYRDVEAQRHNGTTVYPDWIAGNKREIERYENYEKRSADRNRNFGKEVEEKGWDHPEVRRQWEKQYGREKQDDPQYSDKSQVVRGYRDGKPIKVDKEELDQRKSIWREAHEKNSPGMRKMRFETETSRAAEREKREPSRNLNAEEQRLKKKKEYEDARVKNWQTQRERRDKEEGRRSPKSEPPWRTDERRTKQWRQQKELERDEANSVPLPRLKRDSKDQVYRPQQGRESPALPRPQEIPMPKIEPRDRAPAWFDGRRDTIGGSRRDWEVPTNGSQGKEIDRQQEPKFMGDRNKDVRTPQQIAQDEHGMIGKEVPEKSQEIENKHQQRAQDYYRDEEPDIPLPGQEKPRSWNPAGHVHETLDRLDPPTPAQGRDDLNASVGAPQSFQQQLDESLSKIKVPKREIGKDRERER